LRFRLPLTGSVECWCTLRIHLFDSSHYRFQSRVESMAAPTASCSGCQALRAEIAQLRAENAKLRSELDEVRRQQHRQASPFRRKERKAKPKRPGRPKGHAPALRPTPTPDQIDRIINVPCDECPDCHSPLYDLHTVVQYQTDLPPITPIVTQFNIQTGRCPCCREKRQGRHPEQTSDAVGSAGNTFGPVVLTLAAELKHRLGVPYRKICDFFSTYCDLEICPATFVRAEQRLAELAQPTFELLIDALRRAHVVHADETGWRVNAVNGWLWVFSSKDVTVYVIRTGAGSRGHGVPADVLGPDFDGYLIVDGFAAYDVLDVAKGRCNAHLLRRCKELKDTVPAKEQKYLDLLRDLLLEAIDLAARREELKPEGYARRVQEIENRLDTWLDELPRNLSPELDRLDNHTRAHRGEWLVFLHDAEVPPTNNHAEQMLRPAVISRKIGGCNKTLRGAVVHGMLASLMVTCKRMGRSFLSLARQLWQTGEAKPIDLNTLPAT
jgi:transposase